MQTIPADMSEMRQNCQAVMIVKALPNPSKKYGETVCCAGVTLDGHWKRLYPVRFRHLSEGFKRWDIVKFGFRRPADTRPESCHVFEDTIEVVGALPEKERPRLLTPLITGSTKQAAALGRSLTLIRPSAIKFIARPKPSDTVAAERAGYTRVAKQGSFLDKELAALEPSPFVFSMSFADADGAHTFRCGDWETTAAYWRRSKTHGAEAAIESLRETYEDFFRRGLVFAMGTVKARPKQWLLLGVVRLNEQPDAEIRQGRLEL